VYTQPEDAYDGLHTMTTRTDAELLAAARTDAEPFRELYDRYAAAVHRFHATRTGERDAALDLTAETFAQAWLSRDRFRDLAGGSAGPWLYAIARHVLLASVRKRALEQTCRERLGILLALDRSPAQTEPREAWLDGLDEALDELPPEIREAVALRVLAELPYDQLGAATGMSPGAARVRVHRGLTALRDRLLQTKEATR
jgi:RNA polymerase sigma factor (sigma-70 family)